jgi:hypothetical protein
MSIDMGDFLWVQHQPKGCESMFYLIRLLPLAGVLLLSACVPWGEQSALCKMRDAELAAGSYRGACLNGWAHGYGIVTGASLYRGDFVTGKKHGLGVKVMSNGDRYTGEFYDDYRHGHGEYVWGAGGIWAGDSYVGEYQRDLRHGMGSFVWGSGDRYIGEWRNDLRLGSSILESRRAKHRRALLNFSKEGMLYCAISRSAWQPYAACAEVVQVRVQTMLLRVTQTNGEEKNAAGAVLQVGELLADVPVHWQAVVHP